MNKTIMKSKCTVDISARPLTMTIEKQMKADASAIYEAWTEKFDLWFAEPGDCMMKAELDRAWFFKARKDWGHEPHYGRFVELEQDKLVVTTWLTGTLGTAGAETLICIELTPNEHGTFLKMTHSGFYDQKSCDGHKDNWPEALDCLEEALSKRK